MSVTCNDLATIGKIIENNDGSVSAFIKNANNTYVPYVLNEACCLSLNDNYIFDEDTQSCRWVPLQSCSIENIFKLTLNPDNNGPAFFYVGPTEECTLTISFDYLFKTNCGSLPFTSNANVGGVGGLGNLGAGLTPDVNNNNTNNGLRTTSDILTNQITQLEKELVNTPYSIIYNSTPSLSQTSVKVPPSKLQQFSNTGFGLGTSFSGLNQNLDVTGITQNTSNSTIIYCLTDPSGLNVWATILGTTRYSQFLNGDANSYDKTDVDNLISQNTIAINNSQPILIEECQIPFGERTRILNELSSLRTALNQTNEAIQRTASTTTRTTSCSKPIDFFENLDVSMSLDVIENTGARSTVYTSNFFPSIGGGGFYDYLYAKTVNGGGSGFYVEGFPDNLFNTNINNIPTDIGSCQDLSKKLINEIYDESGLAGFEPYSTFIENISVSAFSSNWLHYSFDITDQDIIQKLANNKITLNIIINHTCGTLCVLMDNIVLEKKCKAGDKKIIHVTKNIGFELDKIKDNKKSWVNNQTLTNRTFKIDDVNNTNEIRKTNYNVEDERLVINTKEIDLDLNIASAIEYDVWKFTTKNPCILTGTSTCNPCTTTCCGDSGVNFTELITQPLSGITVLEDFEYTLTSELIDAKNRQTISGYATLKALYDRYMNASNYCGLSSNSFDYKTMDQLAGLVDYYWIDIIEQVIPSTTMFGASRIYTNTIFDEQKFKYKAYSSLFCTNPFYGSTVLSPINKTSGLTQTLDVNISNISISGGIENYIFTITNCDKLNIAQMNFGSEFIGTVNINNSNACSNSPSTITNCDLSLKYTFDGLNITAYVINGKAPISYQWSNGDVNASTTFSGAGFYTVTVTDGNCCTKQGTVAVGLSIDVYDDFFSSFNGNIQLIN